MGDVLRASYVTICQYAHARFPLLCTQVLRLLGPCVASTFPAQDLRPTKLHGVQRTASTAIRKVIARPELFCKQPSYSPGSFWGKISISTELSSRPHSVLHRYYFSSLRKPFACQVQSDIKVLQPSALLRSMQKIIGKVGLQR